MNKTKVFYILPHIDRIGEVANQLFLLRNLFPEGNNDLNIITYPLTAKANTNIPFFQIAARGLKVDYTCDEGVLWSCYQDQQANEIRTNEHGDVFVLLNCGQLRAHYYREFTNRIPTYHYSLSDDEKISGNRLRESFGIPQGGRIVTLHIRDGACFGPPGDDAFRNADISNYIPAIGFLLEKGFHVVRLGDKAMPPLGFNHPHLYDAPHHPSYASLVEPYFIANSTFLLGTSSGPLDIAHGFNIPALVPDTPIQSTVWGYSNDLFLFKKYYSEQLGRALSYGEVLASPAPNFFRGRLFTASGIHLVDNTPEEIVAATKEMVLRLEGGYPRAGEAAATNRLRRNIESQYDILRQHTITNDVIPYMPFYAFSRSAAQISHEYARMNPWFYGHFWPEVRSWGWEPELMPIVNGQGGSI